MRYSHRHGQIRRPPSGYLERRRYYERGQRVLPFHSNLQPGTEFYESIEYFRTHPGAYNRVYNWLHREILALLGGARSQARVQSHYFMQLKLPKNYNYAIQVM